MEVFSCGIASPPYVQGTNSWSWRRKASMCCAHPKGRMSLNTNAWSITAVEEVNQSWPIDHSSVHRDEFALEIHLLLRASEPFIDDWNWSVEPKILKLVDVLALFFRKEMHFPYTTKVSLKILSIECVWFYFTKLL